MSLCRVCMLSSLPVCLPVLRALRVLCLVLSSYQSLCFLSSFSTNLIDPYVTVPIDVSITLPICLSSFPICIFVSLIPANVCLNMYRHTLANMSTLLYCARIRTYLPPHVHSCLPPHIHTYLNTLLYEPLVPLRFLLRVNPCVCASKHVCAFPSSSIFVHTYRHLHMYGLCSVLCLSPSFFFSSVFTNSTDTYVTVRTTCSYAYPLFPSVSSFL